MKPFFRELQTQLYKRITDELNKRDTPNFTQFQYAYMQVDKISLEQFELARNLAEVREFMEKKFHLPKIPMNTWIRQLSGDGESIPLWWWPYQEDEAPTNE